MATLFWCKTEKILNNHLKSEHYFSDAFGYTWCSQFLGQGDESLGPSFSRRLRLKQHFLACYLRNLIPPPEFWIYAINSDGLGITLITGNLSDVRRQGATSEVYEQ
ncbi:hypothetical protein ACFL9T_01875 [Thermodesulfobacteriota bacterium]